MSKFYTYQSWVDTFQPIKNKISKYATDDLITFETYGEEHEYIKLQDDHNVWTEVDGDSGTYILSGYHYVNRIQYYITANPWDDEMTEVPSWMERQCDCQELVDIDLETTTYCDECEENEGYIVIPCETVEDLKQIYGEDAPIVS